MDNKNAIYILKDMKKYFNDPITDKYYGFDDSDNEAIDIAIECINFTDEVLGILGTFGLPDIYVRRDILDYLFKHKDKYKKLCKLWDQIVGNFS